MGVITATDIRVESTVPIVDLQQFQMSIKGNAPVRIVVNVTFGITTCKEHLKKEVIWKAFKEGAVKSGLYGAISAIPIDKIKEGFAHGKGETSESEECSYAN